MADFLIRGLKKTTVDRLKSRARRRGRSLQGEVKSILEEATAPSNDVGAILEKWRKYWEGKPLLPDSTRAIREWRDRDR